MKLLVLGGTRFLGRHVVDAALARGDAISRCRSMRERIVGTSTKAHP